MPEGQVYVVVRQAEEPRSIVSVAPLVVHKGQGYFIKAYPASTQELVAFPDPKG